MTMALFAWLFVCVIPAATAVAPDTLRMVNVLYRHGDRSPVATYPTDPYQYMWPQGFGWLTTTGMQQQYALGQFLRSEYGNILNSTYNNTEILVTSSDVNRTLMSAASNLAGLYPPHGDQVWNPSLLWQPIPIHTRPQNEDHVLAIAQICPTYNSLYAEVLQSPAVMEMQNSNQDFFHFIENCTGVTPANVTDVWTVADSLYCCKVHNLSLPKWANEKWDNGTVYDKLRYIEVFGFNLLYDGTALSRLTGGPLLKVFIQNMNATVHNIQPYNYRMRMYSGHDNTVAAVSDAMQVYNHKLVPYAAALLVELHQMDSSYCVKIRYRNDTTLPPFTLIQPDCQKECCPLEEFVRVTKSRVPVDWRSECGYSNPVVRFNYQVTIGLLVGLCTLLVVLLILVFWRSRGVKSGYVAF